MEKINENEVFKEVPGYEGRYLISDYGRVYSAVSGKMLTLCNYNKGHRSVTLFSAEGKPRTYGVHILVMKTFKGEPPEGTIICHINGDGSDNRLANLYYGTYKDNRNDSLESGRCRTAKLKSYQVVEIYEKANSGNVSPKYLANVYGVSEAAILAIKRRTSWKRLLAKYVGEENESEVANNS